MRPEPAWEWQGCPQKNNAHCRAVIAQLIDAQASDETRASNLVSKMSYGAPKLLRRQNHLTLRRRTDLLSATGRRPGQDCSVLQVQIFRDGVLFMLDSMLVQT